MADMICIALSAKNLHKSECSNSMEVNKEREYFISDIVYKSADQIIWPIQQKTTSREILLLEI